VNCRVFRRSACNAFIVSLLAVMAGTAVGDNSNRDAQARHHISVSEAQKQGVGQNIHFVEQLIHGSMAARQIKASGNDEAMALQQEAEAQLATAMRAQEAGDDRAAEEALTQAKQRIFQAMRLTGDKGLKDNQRERFKNRYQSTKALLEALQRVGEEKHVGATVLDVEAHARDTMRQASSQFDQGALDQAQELIDSAYLSIKLSLTRLRNGETLVRSLHFDTKEDEYHYELDRNDTHKMLVSVLLKEKSPDSRLTQLIAIPMKQAAELRAQAEQQAADGDFETAIKTLEQSTKQIIRAIRATGIYIPG
jgi:hypothetical protein